MNFIKNPNLPNCKVKAVLLADSNIEIQHALNNCAVKTISITAHESMYQAVCKHPDMQVLHLGNNYVLCSNPNAYYCITLKKIGFNIIYTKNSIKELYPFDVLVNCVIIKNNIICNKNYIDPIIIDYAKKLDLNLIHTKQGYTKCSVCVVSQNAIITSDKSIYKSATNHGIDVLLIRPGHIILEGLDYGFIGGASGLIDKNILAFTGNIELHPDFKDIKLFLDKYSVKYVCLTDGKLKDVGSLIPIICH